MPVNKKMSGLGKGLDALIATNSRVADIAAAENSVVELDINKIEPNRDQPRKYFEESSLEELAESLKEYGMIQPVIVKAENGYYSLIAGERRWRAARLARLPKIPAIVKDYSPVEVLQIALVENIQRKDLNPIEEALCYRRFIDEFFYTQENVSQKVGKSRHVISNALSLLNLDPRVQNFIVEGKLSSGHGRLLLSVDNAQRQFELAEKIIDDELSIREASQLIKMPAEKNPPAAKPVNNTYQGLESDLKALLGTKVQIRDGKTKGKIEIEYYSQDELERIVGLFKKTGE